MSVNSQFAVSSFENEKPSSSLESSIAARQRYQPPRTITLYTFIALICASVFLFWAPLYTLLGFAHRSEFSYIPIVPSISAYLIIFRRRYILRAAKFDFTGAFIIAVGLLLSFLVKYLTTTTALEQLELSSTAVVFMWVGFFVLCYGVRAAHAAMLPLALLIFIIPPPTTVAETVIAFLQHGSAVVSYSLFRAIGIPAIREGMTISLPHLTIEVAPECSGIRSSLSLLILTLAGANLYLRSNWNKVLSVLLLVPLSIVRNAVRIVSLSTLALYVDPSFLRGALHRKGGILFFFLALAVVAPVMIFMRRCEHKWSRSPRSIAQ